MFSISVAILFFFPVLQIYSAFFQLLGSIMATYLIAKYYKSPNMPWVVFVYVFLLGYKRCRQLIELTAS